MHSVFSLTVNRSVSLECKCKEKVSSHWPQYLFAAFDNYLKYLVVQCISLCSAKGHLNYKWHFYKLIAIPEFSISLCACRHVLHSSEGPQNRAGASLVAGAHHQNQWRQPVRRGPVHLLALHHACQDHQGLSHCSGWACFRYFSAFG